MTKSYILVVDDEPDIRNLVKEILEDEGYEVGTADDGGSARKARRVRRPDLVLMDIWMPDVDGITLLKEWSEAGVLPCPVIMISGHGTVETAVEATRLGAYDFIEKPIALAKLLLTVERALETDRLQRENVGLKRQAPAVAEPIGRSPVMQQLREQVKLIAQHDTPVLLLGEPGSGKETFARYLHACSNRREGPFTEVGVGAIARENSAVELFGREDGGKIHYGRLEQANGGVLFFDELGDMDLETQSRLLGALENKSFLRIGGREQVQINVRTIAASHKDLEREVHAGRVREDLYYHLNGMPVTIPLLREHCEDVPELLNFYIDWFVEQDKLPYRRFSVAAQNRLRNHHWRGNIRELKNLVQRLLILGSTEEVGVEEIEAAIGQQTIVPSAGEQFNIPFDLPLREAREEFERIYLTRHLQQSDGSVGKLAKLVGMERTHLYRKLRSLGVDPRNLD